MIACMLAYTLLLTCVDFHLGVIMLELSENEIRDIVRYLEAKKPLPDKYRFLLFEDKREVELVWNGKTDDICNVVLPFQIIEQVDEPRAEADTTLQGTFNFGLDSRGGSLRAGQTS